MAGTAPPNWPKTHLIPCNMTLRGKTGGSSATGGLYLAGYQAASGDWLPLYHFVVFGVVTFHFSSLTRLSLSWLTSFSHFCPSDSFSNPVGQGGREGVRAELPDRVSPARCPKQTRICGVTGWCSCGSASYLNSAVGSALLTFQILKASVETGG